MATFRSFEETDSWRKARELTRKIYKLSSHGELANDFALRDQIRRAAISIMSNIAEGFERGGRRDFLQFLSIAKGSTGEVKAQLYIALDQGYISLEIFRELGATVSEIGVLISGLMSYVRASGSKGKENK